MSTIASRRHPFVQRCRSIAMGRGPVGEILLEGPHLVEEALAAGVPLLGALADGRVADLARRVAATGVQTFDASAEVVAAASPVQHSAGIVAVGRWAPMEPSEILTPEAAGPCVALVDVQDPGNVGSIIRSADALGATSVLALDTTASPAGWKALRAAMGSTFRVPVGAGPSAEALAATKRQGYPVVATVTAGGLSLYDWRPTRAFVLVVGNEGSGLPQPIVASADVRVTIPMRPGIDSLNVGISTALVLSEAARCRRERP